MAAIAITDRLFDIWRQKLTAVLRFYETRRRHIDFFFPKLVIFFFVLNVVCYWLAISTAFPERAFGPDWLRYTYIQFPVGLLGAIFDSFSFYVTVYIVRRAIATRTKASFMAHLSIDFVIAVLATMWVLIVFSISTWAVDTFILYDRLQAPPVVAQKSAPQPSPLVTPAKQVTDPVQKKAAVSVKKATGRVDRAGYLARRSDGYQQRFIDALREPFAPENLRNIYFGLLMGASAMLPSLLHIALSFYAILLLAGLQISRRSSIAGSN
jgi:hypothetical protein